MYFCLLTFCDVICYVHFCVTSYSAEHRQLHCWVWPQCELRVIIALSTPCASVLFFVDILWCPMLCTLLYNLIFSRASSIALLKMAAMWVPCHNCYFCSLPKWLLFVDILWCPTLFSFLCLLIFRPTSSIALLSVDKRWVSCHNCYFCPLPNMYLPWCSFQVSRALGAFRNVGIQPNNVSAIAKVGHLIFFVF